jgi:hypothetical protein
VNWNSLSFDYRVLLVSIVRGPHLESIFTDALAEMKQSFHGCATSLFSHREIKSFIVVILGFVGQCEVHEQLTESSSRLTKFIE